MQVFENDLRGDKISSIWIAIIAAAGEEAPCMVQGISRQGIDFVLPDHFGPNMERANSLWPSDVIWWHWPGSTDEFFDIRKRAILQEVLMNLICNMCSEITLLK